MFANSHCYTRHPGINSFRPIFGLQGKTLRKFCIENNIEQKSCGLVEGTIQTKKKRLGVIILEENKRSIKFCLSTIFCDLRCNKQKIIQVSPFQQHFGRLSKNEYKIIRYKFITKPDYLDKQQLERKSVDSFATQKEDLPIQGEHKNREKGGTQQRHESDVQVTTEHSTGSPKSKITQRTVGSERPVERRTQRRREKWQSPNWWCSGQSNPELRKEKIYSWEKWFIEDRRKRPQIHQRQSKKNWPGIHETAKRKNNVRNRVDSENFRRIHIPKVRHRRSKNQPSTKTNTRFE